MRFTPKHNILCWSEIDLGSKLDPPLEDLLDRELKIKKNRNLCYRFRLYMTEFFITLWNSISCGSYNIIIGQSGR